MIETGQRVVIVEGTGGVVDRHAQFLGRSGVVAERRDVSSWLVKLDDPSGLEGAFKDKYTILGLIPVNERSLIIEGK